MEKYINKLMVVMIIGCCFLSCGKDFLSTVPSDKLSDKIVFTSIDKAQLVLIGAYDGFSRAWSSHNTNQSMLFVPDVMGDDALVNPTSNYARFVNTYQYANTPTGSDAADAWANPYGIIDNVNAILDNIKNLPEGKERDRIQGEALALRAYSYHFLVKLFAKPVNKYPTSPGVVLRTQSSVNDMPRATVQDAYTLLVTDLKQAIALLNNSSNKAFIDKRAAEAILARVYLDLGDETNGIQCAENAVNGLSLIGKVDYQTKLSEVNSETLWAYEGTASDNQGYHSSAAFWYYADGYDEDTKKYSNIVSGYNTLRVSKGLYDLMDDADVRKTLFPLTNKGNLMRYPAGTGGVLTTKMKNRNNILGQGSLNLLRASEMYLIIAELAADKAHYDKARIALNTVRVARGLSDYPGSDQELVNEIQTERRRELFTEGHRLFDLKRRHLPLKRSGVDGHILWTTQIDIPTDSDKFEFPIPQDEIDANGALSSVDQNPAYK